MKYEVVGLRNIAAGEDAQLALVTNSPAQAVRRVRDPTEFALGRYGRPRLAKDSDVMDSHKYRAIQGSPLTRLVRPSSQPGLDPEADEVVIPSMAEQAAARGSRSVDGAASPTGQHAQELGSIECPEALCRDADWASTRRSLASGTFRTGWGVGA